MTRCVGAYLKPCLNATDTILCDDCWALLDRVMSPARNRAANQTRRVYRKKAKAA